ncbi:MAG TPA: DUF6152 family protein [Vicinamibacterales bacterium]
MRTKLFLMSLIGAIALSALPVKAHHAFAAEFDVNQPITLRGVLSKMEFVNPHGWIYIDVKSPDGKVQTWAVESVGPNALLRRGLRKTDFPIGAEVVVKGYKAKNGTNTANGRTITFADGRNFFMGSADGPADGADKVGKAN